VSITAKIGVALGPVAYIESAGLSTGLTGYAHGYLHVMRRIAERVDSHIDWPEIIHCGALNCRPVERGAEGVHRGRADQIGIADRIGLSQIVTSSRGRNQNIGIDRVGNRLVIS